MARVVLIRSNPVSPDPPVEKMANALLGLGHSVHIIGWDRSSDYPAETDTIIMRNGNARITRFGIKATFGGGLKGNLKPLYLFQKNLSRWLNENKGEIDIVHAFDFDTGFVAERFTKRNGIKLVYHMLDYYIDSHNLGKGILRDIVRKLENKVIEEADATIICTEKRKEQIAGSKAKRLYVIHNTPDVQSIDPNITVIKSKDKDKMKIVYVGILANSRMLREMAEIVANDTRYEFHIGGFGKLESVFDGYAKKYENIYFYGKLPYAKTLALEKECDVMVAIYDPSVRNNQYSAPNKFYESLMIGKPIIMAKGTGFDSIIDDNSIGITVDFSKDGIRRGFEELLDKKENWHSCGTKAKLLYSNEYSWSIMERRIQEIYESILS